MSEGATGQGAKTLCSLHKSCARSLQTPPPTLETWQHLTMAPRYRSKEHAAAPSILSLTQDELVNILGRLSLAERCAKRVAGFLRPRRPQHRRQRRCSPTPATAAAAPAHTNRRPPTLPACRRGAAVFVCKRFQAAVEAPELQHTVDPRLEGDSAAASLCLWLLNRGAPLVRHLDVSADYTYVPDHLSDNEGVDARKSLLLSALAACARLTQLAVRCEWPGLGGVGWQQGMARLRKLSIWLSKTRNEQFLAVAERPLLAGAGSGAIGRLTPGWLAHRHSHQRSALSAPCNCVVPCKPLSTSLQAPAINLVGCSVTGGAKCTTNKGGTALEP